MGSHTGQYGNLSTVSSTRAGTDITLPLIDGELSQPSSTIREMLEETCSGMICTYTVLHMFAQVFLGWKPG